MKKCRTFDLRYPNTVVSIEFYSTYFQDATSIFFEVGLKLVQVVWRKISSHEIGIADGALVNAGLQLISENRLPLALEIHRFANEVLKNVESDRTKRVLLVNYANFQNLVRRHIGIKLLSRMDWSAAGLDFEVPVASVQGQTDKVVSLMKKAVTAEALSAEKFRTWPVFREMYKQRKFTDAYKKIFGNEFVAGASTSKVDLGALMRFLSDWTEHEHATPDAIRQVVST